MRDISSLHVLLVEDLVAMRGIIVTILKSMGISSIVEATNGREALNALREMSEGEIRSAGRKKKFDLIITDWKMPYVSGMDLVKEIRHDPKVFGTPVLMITCIDDEESVIAAANEGVRDYIIKPFSPRILEAKIRSVLDLPEDEATF